MVQVLNGRSASGRGGFLDPFFEPHRRQRSRPSQTVGVSGTAVYGGFLDSPEQDPKLVGRERYRTFSEMIANTTIVGAGVRLYLNLVARARWKVEPADESPAAGDLAEQVDEILHDLTTPWHRVVRRAAMYKFYGFSVQEWTAKRLDDGTIGLLDVEPRPQMTIDRWDLDESGTVMGVMQTSPQTQQEIYLPRERLVYAVDDSLNDSPEGLGIFRHIVEAVRHLRRYQQLEGYGYETDLRGVPVGRGPFEELRKQVENAEITPAEKLAMEQGLRAFCQGHIREPNLSVLLDSVTYETVDEKKTPSSTPKWSVDLLQGQSTGHQAVAAAIERLNRSIAQVIGVDHILLGPTSGGGTSGSLALAKSKADVLALVIANTLQEVGETFESDLVDPLFEMNGWDKALRPTLKPDAVQHRDVEQITGALRDLAQAGSAIGPQDEAFMEVFDLLGLSRPDVEDMARDAALGGEIRTDEEPEPPEDPEGNGAVEERPDEPEEDAER